MNVDLWRTTGTGSTVMWDMLDGPMPRAVLGIGDPDVHFIDGRWTMFLGGFSTSFRNRLYQASLTGGSFAANGAWQVEVDVRGRALPLVPDPPRGNWDAGGMHTPSYVAAHGGQPARMYYTGRHSSRQFGPGSRYSIGVLEQDGQSWKRVQAPVVEGDKERPSVLEPMVVHIGDRYRMWYQANPHEIGPGEQPDYELRCCDSFDGLVWSKPVVFSDSVNGFFDNTVLRENGRWLMILARGSNLHDTAHFPPQGLWWTTSDTASNQFSDWAPVQRLLDTDTDGAPEWCRRGTYGPAAATLPDGRTIVFATGTRDTPSWPRLWGQRLRHFQRPPVPAPFQLATGALILRFP